MALHLGGGQPPRIEIISEKAINNYKILMVHSATGELRSNHGYRDDKGFDIGKHTPYLDSRFPKSALQKMVLKLGQDAAYSIDRTGTLGKDF